MSTLDRLFGQSDGLADYAGRYALYLAELLTELDCEAIERVGHALEEARREGSTIFVLGNGGSAATASHLANDLGLGPRARGGETYRIISLSDNVAFLTAAGNDISYDMVFVEQLKTLLRTGDVVLAISVSGNSPNVVKAMDFAKKRGAVTIALTGFDGGALRLLADECIHVATPSGDYGPVEDMHLIFGHLVSSYLARLTAGAARTERAARTAAPVPGISTALRAS